MPYLRHVSVVANGGMPGGERWSCSVSISGQNTAYTQDGLDDFAATALSAWAAAVQSQQYVMSDTTSLQRVDVRVIDTQGRTELLAQQSPGLPVVGPFPATLPNQCAIVVSLRSQTAGARGRGRFYLPCLATSVDGNGRLPSLARSTVLARTKTLLDALSAGATADLGAGPQRIIVASGAGTGSNAGVTSIRVGDVIDTQRRRRDALVEAYVTAELNVPA